MKRHRTVIGWLSTILGGLGVVVSIAAIIGVWVLSHRVTGSVTRTASAVTEFTQLTHDRAEAIEGQLAESREKLVALQEGFDDSSEGKGIDPDAVRETAAELQAYLTEYQEWVALAGSAREFMDLLNELLGAVAAVTGAEDGAQASAAIVDGATQVREANEHLRQLGEGLDDALKGVDRSALEAKATPRLLRWESSLAGLESNVNGFNEGVIRAEDAVGDLEDQLLLRIRLVAWLMSVLLIWQAFAQASLASWGGRLRRGL